jgi:hypothetical protein
MHCICIRILVRSPILFNYIGNQRMYQKLWLLRQCVPKSYLRCLLDMGFILVNIVT